MAERELRDPLVVAKAVLRAALSHLEYFSNCAFCDAGHYGYTDDGGDKDHSDECPLHGFDMTEDVERLKEWADG